MKGQTTISDLFFFAFAIIIVGAFMPSIIETIGLNWSRASPLLQAIYVAMPGILVGTILLEILQSREIEAIRRDKKRQRRGREAR